MLMFGKYFCIALKVVLVYAKTCKTAFGRTFETRLLLFKVRSKGVKEALSLHTPNFVNALFAVGLLIFNNKITARLELAAANHRSNPRAF
mmetsp:Transcript_23394/g.35488  ORF Transcript_23394/g.35488 Transcript_23394/m.35488 type:complete len:90 (-) Transcript_23394:2203-2472(-)